jgi:cysteine dioxygenase
MSLNYLAGSLQDLLASLKNNKKFSREQTVRLLKKVSYSDVSKFVNFSDKSYTRNLIYKSDLFEVMLLCWKKGQVSGVHDHNGSFGIVKVLAGVIEEKKFDFSSLGLSSSVNLSANEISQISDHIGCHSLGCKEQAVTLHVYSPPIEKCNSYCSKEEKWKSNNSAFNTKLSVKSDFSYEPIRDYQE